MFGDPQIGDLVLLQWSVVIGASLVAAAYDLLRRRIPNWLTLPVFAAGLWHAAWTDGIDGVGAAMAAAAVLALPFVLLYIFAGGGAGDAKLMAAIGSWLGLAQGLVVLAAVAMAGFVLALAVAALRKRLRSVVSSVTGSAWRVVVSVLSGAGLKGAIVGRGPAHPTLTVPYGLAIFAGVCSAAGTMMLWSA